MWGKIWDSFECSNLFWRKVDVVIFAGAEKDAGVAVDGGVVVAAEGEAVLEGDALGRVGGQGEDREGGDCGDAAMGQRVGHGIRIQGSGNREQETGIREQGTGNRDQGTGNREQGSGNREQGSDPRGCELLTRRGRRSFRSS
jgi:hypothetical protein